MKNTAKANTPSSLQVDVNDGAFGDITFTETTYTRDYGRNGYARVTEFSNGNVSCTVWSESAGEMVDAWADEERTAENAHNLARYLLTVVR